VVDREPLIGRGYSKQVHRYGQVAVKRPLLREGRAFSECMERVGANETRCLHNEIRGFISEIGLVLLLQGDPTVPKLFAYCIPTDTDRQLTDLALVVELGEPIDLLKYINLGWHQRLRFVSGVLEFLERLQPLVFLDFRRQQFTMRNNQDPMWVDFDNVAVETNRSRAGSENARKVYNTFANKYLWAGRPAGSTAILSQIRRRFDRNELDLADFRRDVDELKSTNFSV